MEEVVLEWAAVAGWVVLIQGWVGGLRVSVGRAGTGAGVGMRTMAG